MNTQLIDIFVNTGVCIALLMLAAWLVSLPLRNASIADIVWGSGFVLVAWVTFFTVNHSLDVRQALLVGIPTFWGLRLSLHLFRRNHGKPEDKRYQAMRAQHPDSFGWVSLVTTSWRSSLKTRLTKAKPWREACGATRGTPTTLATVACGGAWG